MKNLILSTIFTISMVAYQKTEVKLTSNYKKIEKPGHKKTVMAIFAHADDEAVSNASPALAKYARDGYTVYLVIATKGELGKEDHSTIAAGDELAAARVLEATSATEKLGIKKPIFLGFGDGVLNKPAIAKELVIKLNEIFGQYKPDIVITWEEGGGYGHPDHKAIHKAVTESFQTTGLFKTQKLYYTGIPKEFYAEKLAYKAGLNWLFRGWKSIPMEDLTMRITCKTKDFNKAELAMACYKTQFTDAGMEDIKRWMKNATRGTVYFKPYVIPK